MCRQIDFKRQSQQGFTLLEMMVVIAIMAIVATIAAPNINATLQSQRNKETTQSIVTALKAARAESLLRHQDVVVSYNADKLNVTLGSETLNSYVINKKAPIDTLSNVTFKPNKTVGWTGGATTHIYTTYCTQDKLKQGRTVTIDFNGNISVESGASQC